MIITKGDCKRFYSYFLKYLKFSENHTQMELTTVNLKVFDDRMTEICVLSIIRMAATVAVNKSHFHQFAGYKVYCSYIGSQFVLLFNTFGKNPLIKKDVPLCTGYLKCTKVYWLQRRQRLFSTLQTHKNISLYRQCFLGKENTVLIQTSVLYLPLHCEVDVGLQNVCRGTSF